ncbi:MAG: threonine-phosphate decarboxylase CobD [Euryarchaeota archaeon]|nr:threonine-phosphate decarboxylase CobD [Euryarchaeota archaeon]
MPCEHGGRIAELAGETQTGLDFSASLNPFLHPRVRSIINRSAHTVYNYPDNTYARFRHAVATYLGVPSTNVVPGNGSVELIRLFATSVLEKGDTVLLPAPTFNEYEFACRLAGADIIAVPAWERHGLQNAIVQTVATQDVKMVFLCNPNNPTGTLMKREAVLDIAKVCSEHNTFLFVDEVFIELSDPKQSIAGVSCDPVFVLRSLTKSFAVPGLRVGYGVTGPACAAALECIRPPWNLNSIAAEAATRLLEGCEAYLSSSRAKIAVERDRLIAELAAMPGLQPLDSDANFLMVNIARTAISSTEFARRMLRHGLLVRDCSTFWLTDSNYIRIAVRTRTENDRLLDALRCVLDTKP